MTDISIAGRKIGLEHPPYVVAELSANHGGNLDLALATIEMAANCGADAIKLQTYTADTMTLDIDAPDFRIEGGLWDKRGLYELYEEAHTPWEWHEALFDKARACNITIFSTPFDETALELLENLNAPAFKIASFEIVHLPLIRRVARTGKPVVMSTGMASVEEITLAVDTFRAAGGEDLLLLHCVSGYPTPADQSNLRRIPALAETFGAAVGLSDHTLGTDVPIAATALGACFIEKHFTLDRSAGGPDSTFSLEPDELRQLVSGTRAAHAALGTGEEALSEVEKGSLIFRRSIYVVEDLKAGDEVTSLNVRIIRPGYGLAPKHFDDIIGKRVKIDVARGTALTWDMLD